MFFKVPRSSASEAFFDDFLAIFGAFVNGFYGQKMINFDDFFHHGRGMHFGSILVSFWLPFGALLAPFGLPLAPFWLPLAPFWFPLAPFSLPLAHFLLLLVHFCSPWGSIFSLWASPGVILGACPIFSTKIWWKSCFSMFFFFDFPRIFKRIFPLFGRYWRYHCFFLKPF